MDNFNFCSEKFVIVICNTYNHSKYITETLNGFAKQSTKFPFTCVVVDDHSSDGAPEIISEWIKSECEPSIQYYNQELSHVYISKHKYNKNCSLAFYLLKQNLFGDKRKEDLIELWKKSAKYEAICEGDDYWTDPNKLQEQVEFLETHRDYSATTTNALVMRPLSKRPFGAFNNKDIYKVKEIVGKRQFHTATVVFRTDALLNCPYYGKGTWDTFIWCCLLTRGPIHYEGKITCVYRKQGQGITEVTSRINWVSMISKWADTLIECFVPQYVHRKEVVRSITRDILVSFCLYGNKLSHDDKKKLINLYFHNFSIWNILYDVRNLMGLCAKMMLKKKC